jgi:predicted permease
VGAGLFVRSLRQVYSVDPGVDVDPLLLVSVDLRKAGYDGVDGEAYYAAARERALRLPGVESAAMVHFPPFAHSAYGTGVTVTGRESLVFDEPPQINWVTPGYFTTVGTRVLRGREFTDADRTGEPVAVISESFARLLAPAGEPVGTCISFGKQTQTGECTRIVGVVENQRREFLKDNVRPSFYLSRDRDPDAHSLEGQGPTLVVRTRGEAGRVAGQLRDALQGLDPRLPFVSVEPLSEVVRPELLPYRLGATLFTLFGILALALAAVGLYGVLGYFIAERRPEIGIRRALGAKEGHVVRLVIREGMFPVVIGLVAGLTAAFAGARVLEALLFGVATRDPISFTTAALFLFGVALLTSYLPARRAARVDPMIALRHE